LAVPDTSEDLRLSLGVYPAAPRPSPCLVRGPSWVRVAD